MVVYGTMLYWELESAHHNAFLPLLAILLSQTSLFIPLAASSNFILNVASTSNFSFTLANT